MLRRCCRCQALLVLAMQGVSIRATTLIAATFNGGVVVGADTRSSMSTFVANRYAHKIEEVYKGIVLCRSGSVADTQFIADQVRAQLEAYELAQGRPPTTRVAARIARNLMYANKDSVSADVICAGADGAVFALPRGGALLRQPLCLSGSGAAYVTGFLEARWAPDMDEAACASCVERALRLAAGADAGTGGGS